MDEATTWTDWVSNHVVTIVFVTLYVSAAFYMLRLHLSGKFKNFDLADLVCTHDGRADGEKLKVYAVFMAGYYAFFYLLIHNVPAFVTYGPWFIGLFIVHQLGNRMTGKDAPPQASPPTGDR